MELPTGPSEWEQHLTLGIKEQEANEKLARAPGKIDTYRALQSEAQRHQSIAVTRLSIAEEALRKVQERTGKKYTPPAMLEEQLSYYRSLAGNLANLRNQPNTVDHHHHLPRPSYAHVEASPPKVPQQPDWNAIAERRSMHEFRERSPSYPRRQLLQMLNAQDGFTPIRPESEIRADLHNLETKAMRLPVNERGTIDSTPRGKAEQRVRDEQRKALEFLQKQTSVDRVIIKARAYADQWNVNLKPRQERYFAIFNTLKGIPTLAPRRGYVDQLVRGKDQFVAHWNDRKTAAAALPIEQRIAEREAADSELLQNMDAYLTQFEPIVAGIGGRAVG